MYADTFDTTFRITITNTATLTTGVDYAYGYGGRDDGRYDYVSNGSRRVRDESAAWMRRARAALERVHDSIRDLERALEKAMWSRTPRELRVVPMIFLRIGPGSQSALTRHLRARACARQSVPKRTRRRFRTWERAT